MYPKIAAFLCPILFLMMVNHTHSTGWGRSGNGNPAVEGGYLHSAASPGPLIATAVDNL